MLCYTIIQLLSLLEWAQILPNIWNYAYDLIIYILKRIFGIFDQILEY